jgi:23S rRNA (adenine2503-C2)-methyltransferase
LVGLGRNEILHHLENFGIEKQKLKMRTKQIFHWIYNYGVRDWSEMTNITKSLRKELEIRFSLDRPKVIEKQVSNDGTRKYLIQMSPGIEVESVFIPDVSKTGALCVSCKFCNTGKQ